MPSDETRASTPQQASGNKHHKARAKFHKVVTTFLSLFRRKPKKKESKEEAKDSASILTSPVPVKLKHSGTLYQMDYDYKSSNLERRGSTLVHSTTPSHQYESGEDNSLTPLQKGFGLNRFSRDDLNPNRFNLRDSFSSKPLATPLGSMSCTGPEDWNFEDLIFEKVIGIGTYGTVVTVRNRHFHHPPPSGISSKQLAIFRSSYDITCVVKMVKKQTIVETNQIEHITAERNLLLSIDHLFVVKLHKTFQDKKYIYFLMEYVPGGDLFSLCSRFYQRRVPLKAVKFYAAEIVVALQYLHNINIAYRDLKPENVLVARDGHIKLTDFGFSKIIHSRSWSLCGTREYLAPEMLGGNGHDKNCDWWSFGIMIYEMIFGELPIIDTTTIQFYFYTKGESLIGFPEDSTDVDADSKDFIRSLLQIDPQKRLGSDYHQSLNIRNHPFFKDIDWFKVETLELDPPFIPFFYGESDTSYFDEFVDETVPSRPSIRCNDRNDRTESVFAGF